MQHLEQGLVIAASGMGGVFAALLVLMLMVMGMGMIFGKKPAPKKTVGEAATPDEQKRSAAPEPAHARKGE